MAIIDSALRFDVSTAITSGTITSANQIDLGIATSASGGGLGGQIGGTGRDIGVGPNPMYLEVNTGTVNFAGGTSLTIVLNGAPDNGSGSPGAYTAIVGSAAIPTSAMTANQVIWAIPLPAIGKTTRFLNLSYVVNGTYSSGSVSARIVDDRQASLDYQQGSNVGYI